jgi:hypothetical protein
MLPVGAVQPMCVGGLPAAPHPPVAVLARHRRFALERLAQMALPRNPSAVKQISGS